MKSLIQWYLMVGLIRTLLDLYSPAMVKAIVDKREELWAKHGPEIAEKFSVVFCQRVLYVWVLCWPWRGYMLKRINGK